MREGFGKESVSLTISSRQAAFLGGFYLQEPFPRPEHVLSRRIIESVWSRSIVLSVVRCEHLPVVKCTWAVNLELRMSGVHQISTSYERGWVSRVSERVQTRLMSYREGGSRCHPVIQTRVWLWISKLTLVMLKCSTSSEVEWLYSLIWSQVTSLCCGCVMSV